mmetsp:Transcript_1172/g.2870  ORF Transcript_1172/g.2870 Transcript_1172/m.2870 type:complete len:210 (-) Transcript_1172:1013-1642(-)
MCSWHSTHSHRCAITGASAHECSACTAASPLAYTRRFSDLSHHRVAPNPWSESSPVSVHVFGKRSSRHSTIIALSISSSDSRFTPVENCSSRTSAHLVRSSAVSAGSPASPELGGLPAAVSLMIDSRCAWRVKGERTTPSSDVMFSRHHVPLCSTATCRESPWTVMSVSRPGMRVVQNTRSYCRMQIGTVPRMVMGWMRSVSSSVLHSA